MAVNLCVLFDMCHPEHFRDEFSFIIKRYMYIYMNLFTFLPLPGESVKQVWSLHCGLNVFVAGKFV